MNRASNVSNLAATVFRSPASQAGKPFCQRRPQRQRRNRLRDEFVHARIEAYDSVRLLHVRRHGQEGNFMIQDRRIWIADPPCRLDAIHAVHSHIDDCDLNGVLLLDCGRGPAMQPVYKPRDFPSLSSSGSSRSKRSGTAIENTRASWFEMYPCFSANAARNERIGRFSAAAVITPGIKVRLTTETAMWGTRALNNIATMYPKVTLPQKVILPDTALSTVTTKARTVSTTAANRNTPAGTPPNHGPERRVHFGRAIASSVL